MKTRANAYQPARNWRNGALVIGVILYSLVSGLAQAASIITFNAPGAGIGENQGSLAVEINWEGEIAGCTQDNNNAFHGFLRSATGVFTSFDAPNAGMGQFQSTLVTLKSGLNPLGGGLARSQSVVNWLLEAQTNLLWVTVVSATVSAVVAYLLKRREIRFSLRANYESDERKKLRELIGGYYGQVLDAEFLSATDSRIYINMRAKNGSM